MATVDLNDSNAIQEAIRGVDDWLRETRQYEARGQFHQIKVTNFLDLAEGRAAEVTIYDLLCRDPFAELGYDPDHYPDV